MTAIITNYVDFIQHAMGRLEEQEWVQNDRNTPADLNENQILLDFHNEIIDPNTDISMQGTSEKLIALADRLGFNEEAREMIIQSTKISSAIMNIAQALDCYISKGETWSAGRIVGSQAEGSCKLNTESDMDILMFNPLINIYKLNPKQGTKTPYLHMVADNKTPEGYTKLQLFINGHAANERHMKLYESFLAHSLIVDRKGRVFLSNELSAEYAKPFENIKCEKHGPAATMRLSAFTAFADLVSAYICKELPDQVMSWFRRERRYGWPSEETMKLFKQMGCAVVAIGHKNSPEQKLQWRLSFINQEMYLMHNLNMTQYKCYIILKHFRTVWIKTSDSEYLSSYHLKTALFYTIEKSDPRIWQPKFLSYAVLKCLHTLLEWVAEFNCPNYFIPQENMFETKLNKIEKEELQNFLISVFETQIVYLLALIYVDESTAICLEETIMNLSVNIKGSLVQLDKMFSKSLEKNGFPLNFVSIDRIIQCLTIFTGDSYPALRQISPGNTAFPELDIVTFFMKVLMQSTEMDDTESIFKMKLPTLEDIYPIIINSRALRSAFCRVKRCMHSKKASYAMINCYPLTEQEQGKLFDFVDQQVENAEIADALYIRLKQASTLAVVCSHFNTCTKKGALENLTSKVTERFHKIIQKLEPHQVTMEYLTNFTFTCLRFDTIETVMVSGPLQYEIFKKCGVPFDLKNLKLFQDLSLVVIDPIIYLYYLQYKNKEKLNDKVGMSKALYYWENILFDHSRETILWHLDTALNCLGNIYMSKGWYRLAISCFRNSVLIEPLYNSAKLHIVFLLFGSSYI